LRNTGLRYKEDKLQFTAGNCIVLSVCVCVFVWVYECVCVFGVYECVCEHVCVREGVCV